MQREYYAATILLQVPKPMTAALEIIEITIDGVMREIHVMKREIKRTRQSKDTKGFCQGSKNNLEKQEATLKHKNGISLSPTEV